jgi:RNA polymerase sigma-70 factor (ECF subfamily)
MPASRAALPDKTTEDLVHAALSGDVEAFGRLVERFEARVRAVAIAAGLDPVSAEDVAQETFVAAHGGLSGLEKAGAFPGWIARIARNVAVSALRRKGLSPELREDLSSLPIPAKGAAPDEAVDRETARGEVVRALALLEERERLVVTLRHHAGLTYAEIAETMAVPLTTVKGLLFRATVSLRERLHGAWEGMST